MDWLDEAQRTSEAERSAAIARARRPERVVQTPIGICLDCGNDIPEGRQAALPGCVRCVRCQELSEKRKR